MNRPLIKISILAFALLFVISCKKEVPPPICAITNIEANQEFYEDEDIQVIVSADDMNGIITSVLLYVDNKNYAAVSDFPYHFTIKAGDLLLGTHALKVVVKNSFSKQNEASVKIKIIPTNVESPDFVSFSDGKIPRGWQTQGWYIDPTKGFDDSFSLFSNIDSSKISVLKECNGIEFYLNFNTRPSTINFYIDGEQKNIVASPYGYWQKFSYSFPEGLHLFEWEYLKINFGYGVNIDAITFETQK